MAGNESGPEPLDLDAVVGEVDGMFSGFDVWIHRRTGEVYFLSQGGDMDEEAEADIERLLEADDLIEVDCLGHDVGRADRFVRTLDPSVADRLVAAWRGRKRGRWGRFKAALAEAGLRDQWYAFRRDCLRADIAEILDAEGVPYR